ncbi:PA14 domain-containing protein [Paenibacillus chondroitinus]|uniref:PA14 domain-containing protein n=1 Tax=Paenibacillus chondroitinus TaxID=59842 RepID=A0ABU6D554_9BACL|nr:MULTISPECIES: PA14 domain-containing protein [Paenibacillus]MCY9658853.1 PA14 domain-containing protein [Paenibacillus anseongense]MEB4792851.1 PA14 domain-containing protein [Paenibacillus chondroitinus]
MKTTRRLVQLFIFSMLICMILPHSLSKSHAADSNPNATNYGLKADYYKNSGPDEFRFENLVTTVVDPYINFSSLEGAFTTLVGQNDRVNVRWTGQITPEFSENYTFWMIGDNGFRLWIDNKLIIDHWVNDWDKEQTSSPIALVAGKKYDIKVEYFENDGGSNLYLRWGSPSVPKQIVPATAFTLPADFENSGPVAGSVLPDGLHAEFTFAEALAELGSDASKQLSANVLGKDWPIKSAVLKSGDPKTIQLEFEYPMYYQDAPMANIGYTGGGALVYAASSKPLKDFYLAIKNNSTYQIETPWASQVDSNNPLPDYPRPQMVRDEWLNLNGKWEFQPAKQGDALPTGQTLKENITVPFAVESRLSGIQRQEQLMWYKRNFTVPQNWNGQHVKLNFGAVDYETDVYVNGTKVGSHKGGYTSFSFDITSQLKPGENELIVHVLDYTDTQGDQIKGKQTVVQPGGIWYTSVSGIWQTVWLEPVASASIDRMNMVPDIWNGQLKLTVDAVNGTGKTVEAIALKNGVEVGRVSGNAGTELQLPVPNARWWTPDDPFLYDLKVSLKDGGTIIDNVDSYFGMREVKLGKVDGIQRPLLNGKFVFQMGTLDQGYWPDGLYTAPTDEALKFDIEAEKRMDMNMIRKHIKIEPARWYYWADKLGLLVWQDMPSGTSRDVSAQPQYYKEFDEMVKQLQNSPSIIVYIVFNEGWGQFDNGGDYTREAIAHAIKADPTRLINGVTGWYDAGGGANESKAGHFLDWHKYPAPESPTPSDYRAATLGEYGGVGLRVPGHEFSPLTVYAGLAMNTKEELTDQYIRYINTIKTLKDKPGLSAAVYTQISDVEYEINGLLSYDRKVEKVDFARVAAAHRELIGSSNKSDLLTSIQTAKQLRDNAVVGDGPGQYKQQVVNLFSAAIVNAQAAYDNEQTTADGIKTAIAALDAATKQFLDRANNPLPFVDTFDDRNADGWTTYGGEWSAAKGNYTVINGEGYKAVANDTKFKDFTYETDISMSASPNLANAGVIFRVNNPTVGTDNLQGYYAGITLAGRVQLGKLNNNWTELANQALPSITVDTVYRLKVVAKGPNIDVYVDDKLVASAVDGTYTEGAIGVRTYKANATFDNIRVTEMEDAVQPNMTLDGASLVNEGSTFAVKLGVSSVTNSVYGLDVTLKYPADLFELQKVDSAADAIAVVHYVDDHKGSVRMVLANIGGDDRSKHETPLVTLQLKAKGSPNSSGNISVLKAILADEKGVETEAVLAELTVSIEGYVSDGDLNHDSRYSIGDLAILATHYGKNSSSPDWNIARAADLNGDGKVDVEDLAKMAQKVLSQ